MHIDKNEEITSWEYKEYVYFIRETILHCCCHEGTIIVLTEREPISPVTSLTHDLC